MPLSSNAAPSPPISFRCKFFGRMTENERVRRIVISVDVGMNAACSFALSLSHSRVGAFESSPA